MITKYDKWRETYPRWQEGGREILKVCMCVFGWGWGVQGVSGEPLMKGPVELQSEAVIEEDRVEPSRKRNKCMFTMAWTRLVINQLLLISGGSYLPRCAAQTPCSVFHQNHFQSLKMARLLLPLACVYVSWYDSFYSECIYDASVWNTVNIHHTCMSFMIMLKWHHDTPLHATPSFTILLFTYILIPKIAFFKCGSIQNGAQVSGSLQVFNLRPGQQSLLHV